MNRHALYAVLTLPLAAQTVPPAPTTPATPSEIVAAAPATDWTAIPASDLLVMTLAPGDARVPRRRANEVHRRGGPARVAGARTRRVIIQLIPAPFSQGWVGNIRRLATTHWWDGTSVNRVQDNYVVQWGDATEKKPLPDGISTVPETDYVVRGTPGRPMSALGPGQSAAGHDTVFEDFPIRTEGGESWPIHCYGMVGVGRDLSPNTGSGAELYTVIGEAPRHLDRNIALVGRVIEGIEHLSTLPRGTEPLGFYKTAAERTAIVSVRLASDIPVAERPRFEYLTTGSASFTRYVTARANRRDAFFVRPAGWVDICNAPVPVRRVGAP